MNQSPEKDGVGRHLRRLIGFSIVPGLSFAAAIAILPAIAGRFGAGGWIAVALGQSVGAIGGILVALDWPIVGAQMVAESVKHDRRLLLHQSTRNRLWALLLLAAPFMVVTFLLSAPTQELESMLFCLATMLNGLTASWFFAGTGQPLYLVRNEALVRLGAYGASWIGMALLHAPLAFYALCLLAAGVLMPVASLATVSGSLNSIRRDWKLSKRLQSRSPLLQMAGAGSRFVSQAYTYSGSSVVAALAPASLSVYTSLDQIQKAASNGLSAIPSAFQSWIGNAQDLRTKIKRIDRTICLSIIGCIPATILAFVGIPLLQQLLFRGTVHVDRSQTLLLSCLIVLTLMLQVVQLLGVIPLGGERGAYLVTTLGGVAGIILLVALTPAFGTDGALASMVISAGAQTIALMVHLGRLKRTACRELMK